VDERVRCDPKIMISHDFTAPREIGFDGAESFGYRRRERQEFRSREESTVAV